jgi:uncharacterized protein (DUF58 family)
MQFKEFRHYEPGDDIRHMSWPVTARTKRATIKTFEEERELDVILVVDVSGSSVFGARHKRKIDMYAELAAVIGLASIRSGDNFGLLLFSEAVELYLPPKRTRNQVLVAVTQILAQGLTGRRSDLRPAFPYLQGVLRNRSLILVISDFLMPNFEVALSSASKKHEILLMHCYDDAERGSGIDGVYEVLDPESSEFFVLDANSRATKRALAEFHTKHSGYLENLARDSRADYMCLCIEDDYLQRLVHFFRTRGPARL